MFCGVNMCSFGIICACGQRVTFQGSLAIMKKTQQAARSAISVLALSIALGAAPGLDFSLMTGSAMAREAEASDGHDGGRGSAGGHGEDEGSDHGGEEGDEGADHGGGHSGGRGGSDRGGDHGSGAGGQGGPTGGFGNRPESAGGDGDSSEARGQRAGQGQDGAGRPVWAREGIPAVELGRLSVVRSPDQVLDRAFNEALAGFSAEMAAFYNLTLDQMIERLSLDWDNVQFIDSPLQNLALLRDALGGASVLNSLPAVSNDTATLMAAFLGTASDKTLPITADTVIAVTTILGTPVTGAAASTLAERADAIRVAILAGHG
jgi:hypothetical protein